MSCFVEHTYVVVLHGRIARVLFFATTTKSGDLLAIQFIVISESQSQPHCCPICSRLSVSAPSFEAA